MEFLQHAEMCKRSFPVHHLVQNASERPYVAWPPELVCSPDCTPGGTSRMSIGSTQQRFGAHVVGSANLSISQDRCRIVGAECLRNSKVNQLESSLDKQEVCGLEITMDYSLLVDCVHGFQHLLPVESNKACGYRFPSASCEKAREIDFSALHHQIDHSSLFTNLCIMNLHDVWFSTELLQQGDLVCVVQNGLSVASPDPNSLKSVDLPIW
eukprot:CAMPEP_0185856300 /NCGR_PEP_ID=MMETSP1354-20130828/28569_1 /TAXON_ID=708628 /ORGANISM="Erythrolobus madagascarensis, Strain CCMP3276" /LENGTH=210 /DNA_ID=CAMNT_0028558521 /DNA_START=234 /DNA_END=863 /DNA_ORIENTATION=+